MLPSSASYLLWLLSAALFPFILLAPSSHLMEWSLAQFATSPIMLPIIIDKKSTLFALTILVISANVLTFTRTYMRHDPSLTRFTYLILLFVLSMNLLIFIPNLMALLIGWDGLGLTSFILVIYYQNPKSLGAGMITVLSNRIGDALLLLSIAWSLNQSHWSIILMWESPLAPLLTMTILLAAMTKSAQLPFSSWLPAAMAAPTPVSALVHSSTLVTAGVFLLIRFSPFLMKTPWFSPTLLVISSTTMLMASHSALMECDMKKIIALSTLSQLGVMMFSLALHMPNLTLFHLLTHAMFKALLFLCAGSIILMSHHAQDLRQMGTTWISMPTITSTLATANLALCGTPFLSGFYSKDMIIESSLISPTNPLILLTLTLATYLTTAYSIRLLMASTLSPTQSHPSSSASDTSPPLLFPTVSLSSLAIIFGAALNWILVAPLKHPELPPLWKSLPLILLTLSLTTASLLHAKSSTPLPNIPSIHFNATSMWHLTPPSHQNLLQLPLFLSDSLYKSNDAGWLETLGPQGSFTSLSTPGSNITSLQSLTFPNFILFSFLSISILFILFSPDSLHKA
uniref:NADH-ubiquinone oxidoreductase chain 5 n=1 Tax=Questa ersei TaxID=645998 RepID=C4NTU6_9ANNE|nr:NADH dehydrogenase subunit 5 [Questa ersei]